MSFVMSHMSTSLQYCVQPPLHKGKGSLHSLFVLSWFCSLKLYVRVRVCGIGTGGGILSLEGVGDRPSRLIIRSCGIFGARHREGFECKCWS
jgi:hypothetical protein